MSRSALRIVFLGCVLLLTAGASVGASNISAHYERPTSKGGPYKQRVIVFVHGLFGNAADTWTNSQSHAYWPKLLLSDPAFDDSDVYVAAYSSPYRGNTMNVDELAKSLESRLVNDDVFLKHREVVFVCHSLGGLVVQQLLLLHQNYAKQVPFVYFFSSPESGAQIARLGSLFSSDPLLKDTFSGDENEYLQILEDSWNSAHFQIHRLCAYEKKPYKGVLVVDRLSGTRNCETTLPINEDHLGIVKPDGTDHPSYIALRNAVKRYPIKPASPTPKQGPKSRPPVRSPIYMEFIHTELRADMRDTMFTINQPVIVNVTYHNKSEFGVARGTFVGLTIQFIPAGEHPGIKEEDEFKQFRSLWIPHAANAPGEDVEAGDNRIVDVSSIMKLPKELVDGLEREEVYLYLFGFIKWTDDAGFWETDRCSRLLVKMSNLKTGTAIWRECESGAEHTFVRHPFIAVPQ